MGSDNVPRQTSVGTASGRRPGRLQWGRSLPVAFYFSFLWLLLRLIVGSHPPGQLKSPFQAGARSRGRIARRCLRVPVAACWDREDASEARPMAVAPAPGARPQGQSMAGWRPPRAGGACPGPGLPPSEPRLAGPPARRWFLQPPAGGQQCAAAAAWPLSGQCHANPTPHKGNLNSNVELVGLFGA